MLPDPGFLYLSKKHQMALTLLEYGLLNQSGFCVVSGETGSGKTTLLRKLLENAHSDITVGMITNTHKGFGDLLDWVLSAFSIYDKDLSLVDKHQRFMDFLVGEYAKNKTTLLIVDEAQNMTAEKLEELRMLSNVNSEKDQVLQVILAGQPALKDTLRLPELTQFAQRIAVDYHLGALDRHDTEGYIHHRLEVAGAEKQIFTQEACYRLHDYCGGIPRLLNLLCDTVMVYGFADHEKVIDENLVDEMVSERMVDSIVPLAAEPPSHEAIQRKRKVRKETPVDVFGETLKDAANDEEKESDEKESDEKDIKIAVGDEVAANKLKKSYNKAVSDKKQDLAEKARMAAEKNTTEESASGLNAEATLSEVDEQEYAEAVEPIEHMAAEPDVFSKAEQVIKGSNVSDAVLRGEESVHTIDTVESPEKMNGNGWKWISAATMIIVAAVLAFLMRGGIMPSSMNDGDVIAAEQDKSQAAPVVVKEIPDKIKQQLLEAERTRKELAERQELDRQRMEALEEQARLLQIERDEALAKSAENQKKQDKKAVARAQARKEFKTKRLIEEKAQAEAQALEEEKVRAQKALYETVNAEREKALLEKELLMHKAKLAEMERETEIERDRLLREMTAKHEAEKAAEETRKKEQKFTTDPCSSSTARFLSTCR